MIPLMGFCYMLQYMDKLALSQATLFNIRADLVWQSFSSPLVMDRTHPNGCWYDVAPPWHAIFVDIRYILFWVPGLELADIVPDCPVAVGKIFGCFSVCFSFSHS